MQPGVYNSLAALLTYPEGDRQPPNADLGAAAAELAQFAEAVGPLSLHDRQVVFIQTFDLNPVCSLEMGWHLFGENYDRGLLLVKMRQQLRQHGIPESSELPDHLTHALRLLPRMEREEAAYFAEAVVLPALAKMLEALRGKNNPYEHVLEALRLTVRADFPEIPEELAVPASEAGLPILA